MGLEVTFIRQEIVFLFTIQPVLYIYLKTLSLPGRPLQNVLMYL